MGSYRADAKGYFWYVPDLEEEVHFEPYQAQPADDLSWQGDWNVHLSKVQRELSEDEYAAILSVLSGKTREEWEAERLAEGKPISPIGEEKQD